MSVKAAPAKKEPTKTVRAKKAASEKKTASAKKTAPAKKAASEKKAAPVVEEEKKDDKE